MEKVKAWVITFFTGLTSILGILALPFAILVISNFVDYITGLMASPKRGQKVSSYKSFRGIFKKICMWILVLVGYGIDRLFVSLSATIGMTIPFGGLVACLVCVWLLCNEIISILENISDIGVNLPPFLMNIVTYIKTKVEDKAEIKEEVEHE